VRHMDLQRASAAADMTQSVLLPQQPADPTLTNTSEG
jgi:hypothetical protein